MSEETAWKNLVGHRWAVDLLAGAIQNDRVGHAYLITGPEQIGKTTLARLFAQALNCTAPDPTMRPCGRCRSCTLIAADRHPDVRMLQPALSGRGKRTLKIDEIRELQQDLNLAAYEARWKVAILPHFDAATQGAANAFLKTLEEPPGQVLLLLTASEADALLPTITSRCRVIALRPLAIEEIAQALHERWQVPVDRARRLAHLADGRLGWAVEALDEPALLEKREEYLNLLREALDGRRVERFALADRLARDSETLPEALRVWGSWWRDITLYMHGNNHVVNVDRSDELAQLGEEWSTDSAVQALKGTKEALWQLEHNANARLVMENLLLLYPYRVRSTVAG
ncbi:MAG: DNA polymerase III subunit delta' [Chloroflexota bacterium]